MRKVSLTLLIILLLVLSGCQATVLPEETPDDVVTGTFSEPLSSTISDTGGTTTASQEEKDQTGTGTESAQGSSTYSQSTNSSGMSTNSSSSTTSIFSSQSTSSSGSTADQPTQPATQPSSKPPQESSRSEAPTTTPPASSSSSSQTQPTQDMEAEYQRIINETVAYAESYTARGFIFTWDNSLEFSWSSGAGWMGTPRVKYEGVDGTIEILKYHIDKIVLTGSDPHNGVPGNSIRYKVVQVTVDGDIAFAVLYG